MANGVYNALTDYRTIGVVPSTSRQRCSCGCQRRATHTKLADGCCMGIGCELDVRRWVKSPQNSWAQSFRMKQSKGK